jgi:transposase, IS5 family
MTPYKINHAQESFVDPRLSNQLNPRHELYLLSQKIDWSFFEKEFNKIYYPGQGQPPKPVRLMVGLLILQQMFNCSDEGVVEKWVENGYWQFFCGYDYLQWELPIHPSSLTRFRKRIKKQGIEKILHYSIQLAVKTNTVDQKSLEKAIVDTTVMPKNITYPSDSKLYEKGCELLVKEAEKYDIPLRQNYNRVRKESLFKYFQFLRSRKLQKANKERKKMKTYLGRIFRDVKRKIAGNQSLENKVDPLLQKIDKLLHQQKDDKNKLYSLHEPDVCCISKGKMHKKYEFGSKVSIVITHKEGLVLSSEALKGNPFDGHTLKEALNHAEMMTGQKINSVYVDKGYRGHKISDRQVYISGQRKLSLWFKKQLKRRSAIEPHIGHMKNEGKLGRNYLKGILGDQINALLCGVGHNFKMILRKIIFFFNFFRCLFCSKCELLI